MEFYYSHGGNNRPYFPHRIRVKKITTEAYEWCVNYPARGPFQRFHVEWDHYKAGDPLHKGYDIVQFESESAALLFSIAWGHL